MLLSLRLKEKFDETQEMVKKIFDFLQEFNQEEVEMEWIVTSWCRIKRDMWKTSKKNNDYDKLRNVTVLDYLDVKKSEIKYFYLLEEMRIYNSFE